MRSTAVHDMGEVPAALGLTAEQTHDVLVAACRAPSLHNSQPWRFRVCPDTIEVHADPARRLPVADPDGRELRLACGAAVFNLRITLAALGVRAIVTVEPDRSRSDLVATVRDGGYRRPTPDVRALAAAVERRHTHRGRFDPRPVSAAERDALRRAAIHEGAWLHLVDDADEHAQLTHLAAAAHRTRLGLPAFRAELADWTSRDGHADGVPASAGGPQLEPSNVANPLVAALIAHSDGRSAEVRTGAAMQRVLVAATASGLAAAFLSQLAVGSTTRERTRRVLGTARAPDVVLQLGHAAPRPVTTRRPVTDVLWPASG